MLGDFISLNSLRDMINSIIAELEPESAVKWALKNDTEECKVWQREKGLDIAPHLPVAQSEHYFSDMEDLEALFFAMEDERFIWDSASYDSRKILADFESENINCIQTLMQKRVKFLGSQREFIEKRIKFTSDQFETVGTDEIYLWVSSLPDELVGEPENGVIRCQKLLCFYKIGRRSDLPEDRRGDGKGIYMHGFTLIDGKMSNFLLRQLQFIVTKEIVSWGQKLRAHIALK